MTINTTRGPMALEQLERIIGLEDRPTAIALWVEFRVHGDASRELVRRDTFKVAKQTGDVISTTLGPMPRAQFARVLELEDNAGEMVVAEVFKDRTTGAIVHRTVHVVLKRSEAEAAGVAAAIG